MVRLTLLFRVWPTLKSTRHRYTPVSVSLAFCTASSPGSFSNRKYARLANTRSSDHRCAALKSRPRMSTLCKTKMSIGVAQRTVAVWFGEFCAKFPARHGFIREYMRLPVNGWDFVLAIPQHQNDIVARFVCADVARQVNRFADQRLQSMHGNCNTWGKWFKNKLYSLR